jgi:hypothetical protein
MELWSYGVMELWSYGVVEFRGSGVQVFGGQAFGFWCSAPSDNWQLTLATPPATPLALTTSSRADRDRGRERLRRDLHWSLWHLT